MGIPYSLENVMKRPAMYLPTVAFETAVAFIDGFDLASNRGVLIGFREWLIVKLGHGNNLTWGALVLRMLHPDSDSPKDAVLRGDQQRAVEELFKLLIAFWKERETPNGLRQIYLRYQRWLQCQDWYGPTSADWSAEDEQGSS